MKLNQRINFCLALSLVLFCSFLTNKPTYQTECVSLDTDGYYTIKIWDTKKANGYRPEDARRDAIHAILYAGIAGVNGCSSQQPILSKIEDQEAFKRIAKAFFSNKGKWSSFTRSATTATTTPVSLGKKEWKVYQVSISKSAIRKYLEDLKIIKSLNNQF